MIVTLRFSQIEGRDVLFLEPKLLIDIGASIAQGANSFCMAHRRRDV